jgi:hypothetical protein
LPSSWRFSAMAYFRHDIFGSAVDVHQETMMSILHH